MQVDNRSGLEPVTHHFRPMVDSPVLAPKGNREPVAPSTVVCIRSHLSGNRKKERKETNKHKIIQLNSLKETNNGNTSSIVSFLNC